MDLCSTRVGLYRSALRIRPGTGSLRGACKDFCVKVWFHQDLLCEAEPVAEQASELCLGSAPLTLGHLPVFADIAQDQMQQFCCCFVGWEVATAAHGGT